MDPKNGKIYVNTILWGMNKKSDAKWRETRLMNILFSRQQNMIKYVWIKLLGVLLKM